MVESLPSALRAIALFVATVGTVGALLLKNKKLEMKETYFLSDTYSRSISHQREYRNIKNSVFSLAFVELFLMATCSLMWGYFFMANYKTLGQVFAYDDHYLTLIVGNLISFNNGSFRVIFGYLADRFKF